jgi:hypothetical protein
MKWQGMASAMLLVAAAGCARTPVQNVVLRNVGSEEIRDARVTMGGFRSGETHLSPGAWEMKGNAPGPIPETATVQWRMPDGTLRTAEVPVARKLTRRFSGDICFEINGSNATAIARAYVLP